MSLVGPKTVHVPAQTSFSVRTSKAGRLQKRIWADPKFWNPPSMACGMPLVRRNWGAFKVLRAGRLTNSNSSTAYRLGRSILSSSGMSLMSTNCVLLNDGKEISRRAGRSMSCRFCGMRRLWRSKLSSIVKLFIPKNDVAERRRGAEKLLSSGASFTNSSRGKRYEGKLALSSLKFWSPVIRTPLRVQIRLGMRMDLIPVDASKSKNPPGPSSRLKTNRKLRRVKSISSGRVTLILYAVPQIWASS
mmetsp:Transcript_19550/g.39363  ORF Transcript_19550/g.39363 Transcript_19550/m.39363 type:complete len:246 (-) Transcript_19550:97-834(-)